MTATRNRKPRPASLALAKEISVCDARAEPCASKIAVGSVKNDPHVLPRLREQLASYCEIVEQGLFRSRRSIVVGKEARSGNSIQLPAGSPSRIAMPNIRVTACQQVLAWPPICLEDV